MAIYKDLLKPMNVNVRHKEGNKKDTEELMLENQLQKPYTLP